MANSDIPLEDFLERQRQIEADRQKIMEASRRKIDREMENEIWRQVTRVFDIKPNSSRYYVDPTYDSDFEPNPVRDRHDPRNVDLPDHPPVFDKTAAMGHCPDCSVRSDWSGGMCQCCGLTIQSVIDRLRPKPPKEEPQEDPDLSWPGDGTRWEHI